MSNRKKNACRRSTFFLVDVHGMRTNWPLNPSPIIPLVRGSKKKLVTRSFRRYPIYTVLDVALSAQLENLCASISLLVVISARTRFFRRVKRFMSAIDVALDTRSLSFAGNEISPGNKKEKDKKITEKMFMNFFIYNIKSFKWFAALKILIMDYLFYQRIIKTFASILM